MKITGSVTIRVTPFEIELVNILKTKNITQADIFRRGLEFYEKDLIKNNPEILQKKVK